MFRFLILGLLRGGARLHGYALVKEYRKRSGAEVSTGNFYRELQRLVSDGLIRGADNPSEADPRRMPYEISNSGAAFFDGWLTAQQAAAGSFSEDDLSARALFIPDLDAAAVRALLGRLQDNLWFWGKQLERDRQRTLAEAEGGAQSGSLTVRSLLLARRLKYVAADLDFIEAIRAETERWTATRPGEFPAGTDAPARRPAARRRVAPLAAANR